MSTTLVYDRELAQWKTGYRHQTAGAIATSGRKESRKSTHAPSDQTPCHVTAPTEARDPEAYTQLLKEVFLQCDT